MMKIRPLSLSLSFLGVSALTAACANPPSYQSTANYQNDHSVYYFNDAVRAGARGDTSSLYNLESSMQGGLFEMYPAYFRLNNELAYQDASSIANFTRRYQGSVMGEKLAADYAEEKARQSDYASVRAVANYIENADASEACAVALGFNQSDQPERALNEKPNVWLNTQRATALCDKLGEEMIHNTHITRTDRHERLIRMMRIDRRQLSSSRPAEDKVGQIVSLARQLDLPIDGSTLYGIQSNPNAFFNQFNYGGFSEVNQYLYVYAISQLTHRSYHEAISQLEYDIAADNRRPQKLLSDMARRYAYRSIAVKRMNMNTDDGFSMQAVTWFRNSLGEPFNFEEAEDYAQAAIYFSQWQDVQHAINAMTVAEKNERVWRYWLARSYEMLGQKSQANSLYQVLASSDIDYYGLLARDRMGQRLSLQDIGGNQLPASNRALVMSDPHFARAILLMENNADRVHIDREWNWAVKKARDTNNTALILSAARIAQEYGNYPRSIYAIENSPNVRNAAISHPMPYRDLMVRHSGMAGIDPAWAYGIIRQESRFQTAAQSSASAQGLMQIIPSTARQIARSMGESVGNMNDPNTNIRYGTWYLADLAGRAGGQLAVATAGYNAGPNAARAWLPSHGAISADQYAEAIPYAETRAYVKHVMANATVYGVLLGNPVPITQRMGVVSPRY
ncbi:MAG: lytic transglycosylase domain-containing protein [Moraxella sp.]|nr:lytic transglycosylase domain-containing protein [Moraxella sp.]